MAYPLLASAAYLAFANRKRRMMPDKETYGVYNESVLSEKLPKNPHLYAAEKSTQELMAMLNDFDYLMPRSTTRPWTKVERYNAF
jgi:hypothetical protein